MNLRFIYIFGEDINMIKRFKNNRKSDYSLSWDDHYPKSYLYKRSEEIRKIRLEYEKNHKDHR